MEQQRAAAQCAGEQRQRHQQQPQRQHALEDEAIGQPAGCLGTLVVQVGLVGVGDQRIDHQQDHRQRQQHNGEQLDPGLASQAEAFTQHVDAHVVVAHHRVGEGQHHGGAEQVPGQFLQRNGAARENEATEHVGQHHQQNHQPEPGAGLADGGQQAIQWLRDAVVRQRLGRCRIGRDGLEGHGDLEISTRGLRSGHVAVPAHGRAAVSRTGSSRAAGNPCRARSSDAS